jgi:ABC-type transport system involved in cytochrome c biogenesis permease subunit
MCINYVKIVGFYFFFLFNFPRLAWSNSQLTSEPVDTYWILDKILRWGIPWIINFITE